MAQRHGARVAALLTVALALVLPSLVVVPVAAEHEPDRAPVKAGVTYEWWDPAWHFRVPILLRPRIEDTLTPAPWSSIEGVRNFPVKVEIDFTDAVGQVGADGSAPAWPRDALGRLSSFTFDPDSVRVVAYEYDSGRIERDHGTSGVLAHSFLPGLLDNPDGRNGVYNATSNAVGTVFFVAPDTWRDQALVFVYFDTLENGDKSPAQHPAEAMGILESLHWTRTGTTFFGYLPPRSGTASKHPTVGVLALYANTTVRIQSYGAFAGLPPVDIPRCIDDPTVPTCVQGGVINPKTGSRLPNISPTNNVMTSTVFLQVSPGDDFYFRIDATKPVTAVIFTPTAGASDITHAWFPALDGGLLGTEFRFVGIGNAFNCGNQCAAPNAENTLRIVAPSRDATVTITDLTQGPPNSDTFSIPAFTSVPVNGDNVAYRLGGIYRVVSSVPVAVASMGFADAVGVQGIAANGAPVGRRVVAPVSVASTVTAFADTQAYIYNFDRNSERLPLEGMQPLTARGATASWTELQSNHQLRGELWTAQSSSADVTLLGGAQGIWAFGGRSLGTDFRLSFYRPEAGAGGYGVIVPLYDDTLVTIDNLDQPAGRPFFSKTLGIDDITVKRSGDRDKLLFGRTPGRATTYALTASKPVVVYGVSDPGAGMYAGVLAGKMASPDYEMGPASFFGCVVGFNPKDKGQSQTVKPGDTVTFALRVANLGSAIGGRSSIDNVSIAPPRRDDSVGETGEWKVTPSTTLVSGLATGQESRVTLTIQIPSTAKSGDSLAVTLLAQSVCNRNMRDEAGVRVTVQTKYDFDLAFENGKKQLTRAVSREDRELSLTIRVRNLGTGNDSVNFTLAKQVGQRFGFDAFLREPATDTTPARDLVDENGAAIRPLQLGVGQTRLIQLVVRAPDTAEALPEIPFTVEGTSGSDASVRDQVSATVLLNAVTRLRLTAAADTLPVAPGRDAVFNLTLTNLGGATDVELSRVVALRSFPGWEVNLTCEPCKPIPGAAEPLLSVSIGSAGSASESVKFQFVVKAPAGAAVDTILSAKVVARGTLGDAESLVLTSRVANSFALDVKGGTPRTVRPGETVEVRLLIGSEANGLLSTDLVPASLPAGWALASRDPEAAFGLEPGATRIVTAHVKVRDNEAPGIYDVGLGIQLEDVATKERAVETVFVPFHVLRDVRLNLTIPPDLQAPPGGDVRVPVLVTNVGNEEAEGAVSLAVPSGWRATLVDGLSPVVALQPGQSVYVNFSVRAPEPATLPGAFTARSVIPPTGVPLESETLTPFAVGVLRRDLTIVEVTTRTEDFRQGRTAVFDVAVRNNGTLPAANVEVALLADGAVARTFTIESLPPGETRLYPLVWTVAPATTLTVVVDPRERLSDDDRTNNAYTVPLPPPPGVIASFVQKVPAPPVAALLAAAAAVALARRRWSA